MDPNVVQQMQQMMMLQAMQQMGQSAPARPQQQNAEPPAPVEVTLRQTATEPPGKKNKKGKDALLPLEHPSFGSFQFRGFKLCAKLSTTALI